MASVNITGPSVAVPTITHRSATWAFNGIAMRRREFITLGRQGGGVAARGARAGWDAVIG